MVKFTPLCAITVNPSLAAYAAKWPECEYVMNAVTTETEYIAPDSALAFMLNYWHGWWRFMWHWDKKSHGVAWPDLKTVWAHRKYCDESWDKIGIVFTIGHLSLCFSCHTMKQAASRYREMLPDDIWPTIVLDDPLDAEIIN